MNTETKVRLIRDLCVSEADKNAIGTIKQIDREIALVEWNDGVFSDWFRFGGENPEIEEIPSN